MTQATIADHIKPKAEGGTDDRENYQPICDLCHVLKTAAEAKRAKARKA
ncbi:5-methylcytosine-specific restriction endonuclease McrA [Novosphingobium chloroacetimidivorans]|uniref:5-methylcytosine-specific restriction endonuclease McrA n=1 Tax=Novosphingobium chloroacetimidivorans TaxID=1428314 RepID=A0A7W7K6P8_9SPHN|nr:5-methylcytosine-specific restriction endonuclease McrA [Novosphingobium chloroacetimidivorans]